MQHESALEYVVHTWAQAHVHQRPVHIFLVACNPWQMLPEDPPERAWIADLRLPGETTITLLLGQRRGQYQVEREPADC
jgi:hypothetical protein